MAVFFPNNCKLWGLSPDRLRGGPGRPWDKVPPGFHEGSTRVPRGFHQGFSRVPQGSARAAVWCEH